MCPVCGTEFLPKRNTRIYCDDICRGRAFLMKKSGEPFCCAEDKNANTTVNQRQLNGNLTLSGNNAIEDIRFSDPNSTPIEREKNSETLSPIAIKTIGIEPFKEKENANSAIQIPENANPTVNQRQFNGKSTLNENGGESVSGLVLSHEESNLYAKSEFINAVSELVDERGNDERFSSPLQYWSAGNAELIRNINIYVRCLLESTLKLSRYKSIPVADLLNLANAYVHIIQSEAFENIGYEYPYYETLKSLHKRLSQVYRRFRNSPKLRLVLGFEQKAELIAMLHEIGGTVPLHRFSELFHPAKER